VKTYYKPSQWRGKRPIFQTIDPAERKKQALIGWILVPTISLLIIAMGVMVWLTRRAQ
jgi:hypothetical protein